VPDEEPTMRIAIIAPPWVPIPPPAYGGTETVLDALATGLQALGHDVLLYTTGDSTCAVPTAWTLPHAADTVGITPATEIDHIVHAYPTAQEWGAHIVHDHTLAGPLYANRFAIPVVTTNHGPFDGQLGDYYRAIAPTGEPPTTRPAQPETPRSPRSSTTASTPSPTPSATAAAATRSSSAA
jgi:glycosyltransferase involved in cell wall biosynthesis